MGHAIHTEKSKEVIYLEYLYIVKRIWRPSYVPIVKYEASSFVWLETCDNPYSVTTVSVLLRWFSSFGVVYTWVSDWGSKFIFEVMAEINKQLHTHHQITTPSSPKATGTVKTVWKEVAPDCRALIPQLWKRSNEWTPEITIVQRIINHSTLPGLAAEIRSRSSRVFWKTTRCSQSSPTKYPPRSN